MAIQAPRFVIEGNEVQLPSHVDLVEGLDDKIEEHIDFYDQSTIKNKFDALTDTYLGLHAKADNALHADNADAATKATRDGNNSVITETYYKKTDTVDRAAADDNGNNFRQKYALQTGTYPNMTVGNATQATNANKAVLDSADNNINKTYIKDIYNQGGTTTITFIKGDGTPSTFQTKDTTYGIASANNAGLMSSAMYSKLAALSTDMSGAAVASAAEATRLSSARSINGIPFNGTEDISFHGTCETAADVPTKIVALPGYVPKAGNLLIVRFSVPNTADSPTLNVNNTGDKPVRRGSKNNISNLTHYEFQELPLIDCTTYYRIVDNPNNITVKLTGDVTGEAAINGDAIKIATKLDQAAAFESSVASPTLYENDLNNIGAPGFYRIQNILQWKNRPDDFSSNQSCYLQIYTSSYSNTFIQVLMQAYGSNYQKIYYRMAFNGTPGKWGKVNTTIMETATDVAVSNAFLRSNNDDDEHGLDIGGEDEPADRQDAQPSEG